MMNETSTGRAPMDAAAAALWSVFPDGAPPDVHEPTYDVDEAIERSELLFAFGWPAAETLRPELFAEVRGAPVLTPTTSYLAGQIVACEFTGAVKLDTLLPSSERSESLWFKLRNQLGQVRWAVNMRRWVNGAKQLCQNHQPLAISELLFRDLLQAHIGNQQCKPLSGIVFECEMGLTLAAQKF
ncbi:hypothetical protein QW131_10100 [Roseibium salinum]|nr:hypothetical protein [Roseibium salinum]